MKRKTGIFTIVLFFTVFNFLISCKQQKTEWQGTIEVEDGVTVVHNPIEPIYKADVFSLEEELAIGEAEGREEYMFSDVSGLAVSDDKKIFVLDTKECHIKVFDRMGNYLNSIGRRGQGPGEMQLPTSILITPHKEIMVTDSEALQLIFFTLEGDFIRSVSSGKLRNFMDPKIDSLGNIVASYSIPGRSMKSELMRFNPELEPISSIHSLVLFEMPVMNPFFPQLFWQITRENNVIWGISTEYKLHVLNSEGKVIKKITKDYIPMAITENDKKEKLKFLFGDGPVPEGITLNWPRHKWAFSYLSIDENGNFFLETSESSSESNESYYDVFDTEGRYIAKIPLRARPRVWKKNKLYTIEENEEGFQVVKRYKVNWNI